MKRLASSVTVAALALVFFSVGARDASAQIFITTGGQEADQNTPGEVQRVEFDGTGLTPLVNLGLGTRFTGIALDVPNGHMYFNDWNGRLTRRADLDGTNVINIQVHPGRGLTNLALDVAGNRIYSTSGAFFRAVARFNLDGTGSFATLVPGPPNAFFPDGIALDLPNGHVYYGDPALEEISSLRSCLKGLRSARVLLHSVLDSFKEFHGYNGFMLAFIELIFVSDPAGEERVV